MRGARAALLIAAAFLAGIAGALIGPRLGPAAPERGGAALHRLLHRDLDLDPRQSAALERLEERYALRRHALELEMKADNARLAAAIDAEHGLGPRVSAAIEATHHTMGVLQKETVAHVFAMRALLTPPQARRFDQAVAKALVDDGR